MERIGTYDDSKALFVNDPADLDGRLLAGSGKGQIRLKYATGQISFAEALELGQSRGVRV